MREAYVWLLDSGCLSLVKRISHLAALVLCCAVIVNRKIKCAQYWLG